MEQYLPNLRLFLNKPHFDDPELSRDAQMLWIMILSLNVIGVLIMLSSTAFRPLKDLAVTGGFTVTVFILSIYLLNLLHSGQHLKAAHIFSSFFSILFFINALLFNGIRDVNITIYFLLVLMAGLVLGKKGLAIYGTVALLSTTFLYFAERFELFEAQFPQYALPEDLIILNFVLICACLLIFAALNNTDQGYKLLINALEQLKQTTVSKEYADNLIASMDDMLFVVDQSMCIQTINRSVLSKLGYTHADLVGQPFRKIFASGNEPAWLRSDENLAIISSVVRQSNHQIISNNGEIMDISLSTALIKITEDRSGVICIGHDITMQKAIEQALIEARNEAIEFATAKSNFLTNISHELRTPLNAVIGLSTLLNTTELDEEQQEYSEEILTSSEELLTILEDLLDFSNGESMFIELEPKFIDLTDTIHTLVASFQSRAESAGLNFIQVIDLPTKTNSFIDADKLTRAVSILLDNAIKFTPEGAIEVYVKGVQSTCDALSVWFVISDTGIGIPDHQLDKIFEPFVQADGSYTRQQEGTGIGLALAQMIVQRMGGSILVQSEEGIGSTFSFSIEIEPTAAEPVTAESYT